MQTLKTGVFSSEHDFPKHHGMWYLLCDVVTARYGICDVVSAYYRNVACVPQLQLQNNNELSIVDGFNRLVTLTNVYHRGNNVQNGTGGLNYVLHRNGV